MKRPELVKLLKDLLAELEQEDSATQRQPRVKRRPGRATPETIAEQAERMRREGAR